MTTIRIQDFRGEIPRINDRRLPPNAATIARNCRFNSGTLEPIREGSEENVFGSAVQTIFLDSASWIGWNADVSVARGPVAQDRLYYTGDGAPKMRVSGTVYGLALDAPTVAPTITNLSTPSAVAEYVVFVYTWVTDFGEESAPSPASSSILYSPGVTQRVSGLGTPPSGRNVTAIRIYRSQTSAAGVTDLYFASEIAVATSSYDYDADAEPLAEAITSTDYDTPLDTLTGLISLPNGMMAAFNGRDLYFCEPFIPHAWPVKYMQTVDFPIVGLVGFGSNLAILTTGTPYVAQGLHPDSIALEKLESGLPCVSRKGIVDLGYAAIYPSPEGLILISGQQTENITKSIYSREQWQLLSPETITAARYERKYIFTRNEVAFDLLDGGDHAGWLPADETTYDGGGTSADPTAFIYDFGTPFSSFGEQRLSIIDLEADIPSVVDTDYPAPAGMYFDETTTDLYLLDDDNVTVSKFNAAESLPMTSFWRSKPFTASVSAFYGALFVRTDRAITVDDVFKVRVYGDGTNLREITASNRCERLPSGKLCNQWEIEIESTVEVVSVTMGATPQDVMEGPV